MLSDDGRDAAVDGLAAAAGYMSLHADDPGIAGDNELTGGAPPYQRQQVVRSPSGPGTRDLSDPATFNIPAGAIVAWFGYWTALSGGKFIGADELVDDLGNPIVETFSGQGTYTVTTAPLTVDAG
jgi:hypothetical protein